ncbi:hypothetical protein [Pontibacter qinzhouensis]|uniref:hypothetical protein n=1 Tax=Pontibacter qinzhouensis TaxID=2603253 RepID=UPI0016505CE4|nr:hypothetical protein [Pontibacter qinzhouensis]
MQYKFSALMDNPINEELDYKIMLFMMEKMKENYPEILHNLLLELQNDAASLTSVAE